MEEQKFLMKQMVLNGYQFLLMMKQGGGGGRGGGENFGVPAPCSMPMRPGGRRTTRRVWSSRWIWPPAPRIPPCSPPPLASVLQGGSARTRRRDVAPTTARRGSGPPPSPAPPARLCRRPLGDLQSAFACAVARSASETSSPPREPLGSGESK